MIETWKDIKGYEGCYQVSDHGRVKSLSRTIQRNFGVNHLTEKILQPGITRCGYYFVCLSKDGKVKNFSIHRLVASAFIPNPSHLSDVNHMDGNKKNNFVKNLEWCTRSQNLKHALDIGLIKNQCKICRSVTVKCGEKIVVFDTMKDCAAFFGYKKGWLHNRIRKHGLTFIYDGYEIIVSERGNV